MRCSNQSAQRVRDGDLAVLTKYVGGLWPGVGGKIIGMSENLEGIPWLFLRYEHAPPAMVLPDEVRRVSRAELDESPTPYDPPPLDLQLNLLRSLIDMIGMSEGEASQLVGVTKFSELRPGRHGTAALLIDGLSEHPVFQAPRPDFTMTRRLRDYASRVGLSEEEAAALVGQARFRDLTEPVSMWLSSADRLLELLYRRAQLQAP